MYTNDDANDQIKLISSNDTTKLFTLLIDNILIYLSTQYSHENVFTCHYSFIEDIYVDIR